MGIEIGQSASFSKTISEADVYGFAEIVGDFNPIHVNAIEAEKSIFRKRVAHGMLVGSLISTVLGTIMPGPGTIELEQDLKFIYPTFLGDTVTASVTVLQILNLQKGIYKLKTTVHNQNNECLVDGYSIIKYL